MQQELVRGKSYRVDYFGDKCENHFAFVPNHKN